MAHQVNQPGSFQGQITEFGLKSFDTGAIAVSVKARLDAMWNDETQAWDDWREYDTEANGWLFIVKKNGETNKVAVESLVKFAGWDGSIHSIVDATWQPKECQFTIEANEYNGQTSYRIGFVNDHDRIPGAQLSNVNADQAKQLEAKYGASLRAIAGSAKANGTPAPAAKSMPAPKRKEIPKEIPADSSIPF